MYVCIFGFMFKGFMFKGRHGSGNKSNVESGQNKSKTCSYITTLKVVRTRVKRVRI